MLMWKKSLTLIHWKVQDQGRLDKKRTNVKIMRHKYCQVGILPDVSGLKLTETFKLHAHHPQHCAFKWALPIKSLFKCTFRLLSFKSLTFTHCDEGFYDRFQALYVQNTMPLNVY